MVAYDFQDRFEDAIRLAVKTQTIRRRRDGIKSWHVRPGEAIQLYTGLRTAGCRLIAEGVCVGVHQVSFIAHASGLCRVEIAGVELYTQDQINYFARQDGFSGAEEMAAFFRSRYGLGPFHGVLITWQLLHPEEIAA
jgi:hypothetical protein